MNELEPTFAPASATTADPPWGRAELLKAAALIIGGSFVLLVATGVYAATAGLTVSGGLSSPLLFIAGIGIYALVLLSVYAFAVRRPQSSWALLGVRSFAQWWWPALFVIFTVQMAGMTLINTALTPLLAGGEFENPQVEAITGGIELSAGDLVALLILIAVVTPIAEELFFRGMLYPVLRRRWGIGWAITLNALLFALLHFIPLLIPGLFFVGLILCWVRERSGSVIPGIILHACQNGVVVLAIYAFTQQ